MNFSVYPSDATDRRQRARTCACVPKEAAHDAAHDAAHLHPLARSRLPPALVRDIALAFAWPSPCSQLRVACHLDGNVQLRSGVLFVLSSRSSLSVPTAGTYTSLNLSKSAKHSFPPTLSMFPFFPRIDHPLSCVTAQKNTFISPSRLNWTGPQPLHLGKAGLE
eukprot:2790304-Pleurochrysis_carterae.AAC.8